MVCFCLLLLLQPRPSQSRIGSSSLVTSSLGLQIHSFGLSCMGQGSWVRVGEAHGETGRVNSRQQTRLLTAGLRLI